MKNTEKPKVGICSQAMMGMVEFCLFNGWCSASFLDLKLTECIVTKESGYSKL